MTGNYNKCEVDNKINEVTISSILKEQEASVGNTNALIQDLEIQLRRIIPIDPQPFQETEKGKSSEDYCIFTRVSNLNSAQYSNECDLGRLLDYLKRTI